ncbi:MAG TPA: hypothetical protein PLL10_07085, partial [Elusimicrobiales bacterium]|nr:hypothetical protein [Elusimicrobiales bacterium]
MKNEHHETTENSSEEDSSSLKNSSDKLDSLMNLSGELVITRARFTQLSDALEAETALFREIKAKVDGMRSSATMTNKSLDATTAVRQDSGRMREEMDSLLKLFEDIYAKLNGSSIGKIANSLGETALALGKISSDIQTGVMMARMVPVKTVFQSLEEEIKQLAKASGKEITI